MPPPSAFECRTSNQPDTADPSPPADADIVEEDDSDPGKQASWVMEQFTATDAAGKTHCKCKHCPKTLTGTNVTRLRDHLLNPSVCKFVYSSAAAMPGGFGAESCGCTCKQASSWPEQVLKATETLRDGRPSASPRSADLLRQIWTSGSPAL